MERQNVLFVIVGFYKQTINIMQLPFLRLVLEKITEKMDLKILGERRSLMIQKIDSNSKLHPLETLPLQGLGDMMAPTGI